MERSLKTLIKRTLTSRRKFYKGEASQCNHVKEFKANLIVAIPSKHRTLMQLSILLEFMGEVACLFNLLFNLGEEGNYCIRVYYLSFIQHKSPETICMPEVTIRS